MDMQVGPSRIIRMKFGPQTFGGGDLYLCRPQFSHAPPFNGTKYPGNYVLKYIFYTAYFASGTGFSVFPRNSLRQLGQDLDYTLALYNLALTYGMRCKVEAFNPFNPFTPGHFTAEVSRNKFVEAVLCPSKVETRESVEGYERVMNNFSCKLGGEAALLATDSEIESTTRRKESCQDWRLRALFEQLLEDLNRRRDLQVLIGRAVEEKLGIKPEESGLSYRPGEGSSCSPSEVLSVLEKRRQLFIIFEALVCEYGVDIRKLTA